MGASLHWVGVEVPRWWELLHNPVGRPRRAWD